ncbi:hypothetical protein EI981_06120 [Paenibacillus lutimineralis]|uniref:Terpene synthase n=2 Tax=Paenibacillus lutimineralis TaxID=2707005 RepID=A0A3Q9I764_9BACL|nr:hypothetical protein EI981_06120 [Paenibacillus lutimineralis]
MMWLTRFEGDLGLIFSRAESILATIPEEFRNPTLSYLDKFHPLKEHRSKNYICYLLPYWLNEEVPIDPDHVHQISTANIMGMLYYHLIDETMDNPSLISRSQLPLAQLIHSEFIKIYSALFPSSSPFWTYYDKYIGEWAVAVTYENEQDFFQVNPARIAHRAAPVKLSVAAMMLLSGQETRIPQLEEAVDLVLITLQMIDDWQDWEKDLIEGSYNCLLSMVQADLHLSDRRPTVEEIKQAVYVEGCLIRYSERADVHHRTLSYTSTSFPLLYEFHAYLCDQLEEIAQQIERDRSLLQRGGLEYLLSQQLTKSK